MATPGVFSQLSYRQLGLAACCATISLYGYTYWRPSLFQDDFAIVAQSVTWERAWDGLWIPQNEHAMPLGRLLTFLLLQLAGSPANYPFAAALVGPAALVAAMLLTLRFARRERGHPGYGLAALILFGVSAVYQQAVLWFAASFSILTLDMLLLGLLAAQSYRLSGHWPFLLLCAGWCFLAPCWFASGVLAGPLCALYLLPRFSFKAVKLFLKQIACAAVPLLGTAGFLAVSLPRTAAAIMNLPHYRMQHTDALHAFQPGKGFLMTLRSLVENLLLGMVGVTDVPVPLPLVVIALLGMSVFAVWWWRRAPNKRLLVLGGALIFLNYLLVYSARAKWPEGTSLIGVAWSRYHLLPQLGLAFFLVGGLKTETPPTPRFLAILIVLLWVINLPRGIVCSIPYDPNPDPEQHGIITPAAQQATLRLIERVDARCRQQHVSADTARQALPALVMPRAPKEFNGWEFLQGSATPTVPETRSTEELRRLLED